jgi:polysaccharide export outer membrane protein
MNKLIIGMIALGVIMFSSCATRKIVYVKDMEPEIPYQIQQAKPLEIQQADRISIAVSSKNPELAIPFNTEVGSFQVTNQANIESGINTSNSIQSGYLVNPDGTIDFPILGKIKVEGLNIEQIRETIAKKLIDQKYISDPIVKVELRNLKVNVTGEVQQVRMINAPEGNINLLEALSRAGGISRNAAPDRITVIREENGVRTLMVTNIESKELFNSPAFQLKQNDIVYVAPKDAVLSQRQDNNLRLLNVGLGVISILLAVFALTK